MLSGTVNSISQLNSSLRFCPVLPRHDLREPTVLLLTDRAVPVSASKVIQQEISSNDLQRGLLLQHLRFITWIFKHELPLSV